MHRATLATRHGADHEDQQHGDDGHRALRKGPSLRLEDGTENEESGEAQRNAFVRFQPVHGFVVDVFDPEGIVGIAAHDCRRGNGVEEQQRQQEYGAHDDGAANDVLAAGGQIAAQALQGHGGQDAGGDSQGIENRVAPVHACRP